MKYGISSFVVQWHITAACSNRCRHCYVYDRKTYAAEVQNELSDEQLVRILDDIVRFERKWGASIGSFSVTGGDPLARPGWASFLQELRDRGKSVRVMGTPETLTESNLAKLAELGVAHFQLSLDGLESTHDSLRGAGSFQRTLAGLEGLERNGIDSQIMFTLHAGNKQDLIPLLRFVANETPASSFTFDLLSAVGNGAGLPGALTSTELLGLFESYLAEKERLRKDGRTIEVREKPHLFRVLRVARENRWVPRIEEASVFSGCLVGWTCIVILADGSVLGCRRMPIKVGKMPEESFEDILLGSETLRKFRRPESFAGCGSCGYFAFCRGCPAVVHGLTGDPLAPNPLCFLKHLPEKPVSRPVNPVSYPPLSASHEEEYEYIGRHFGNIFRSNFKEFMEDEGVAAAIVACQDHEARRSFAVSPEEFCRERGIRLNDVQICFVNTFELTLGEKAKARIRQLLFRKMLG